MKQIHKFNFDLSTKQIHLWFCDLEKTVAILNEYISLISPDEIVRANKFKFKKDRNCYILSRGILKKLLGSYLDENAANLKFEYTSYGKPYLPNKNLNFNISHSGNMVVFAFVSGLEIGVDIEQIKTDFDVMELAQNFFSKTEIASLQKQPREDMARAFYRCWTRKEAFIKAEGSGLSFPLNKFAVSLDDDNHALLMETDWDASEKANWSLFSFVPNADYISAVAVRKKSIAVKQFDLDKFTQQS